MDRRQYSHGWRRTRCASVMVLLWLTLISGWSAAQPEPARSWGRQAPMTQWWWDSSGAATLGQARAAFEAGQGQPVDSSRVMPLGPDRAVWYRFGFAAKEVPVRAVLTVPLAGIDKVEFYRPDGAGDWLAQRAGDSLPVAEWPVRYLHPAFIFTVEPGEPQGITYLRVQHSHPIAVNWLLWDAAGYNESNKAWHLILGGYVGFLVLVVLLAGIHAVFWRDSIHLFYGVHVILVGLVVMSLTGLAGEYLWPRNAWWNDIAAVVLPAAAMGWLGLFLRELVAERGRRLLSTLLLVQAAGALVIALAFLVFGRQPVFLLYNLWAAPSLLLFLGCVGWYSLRQPQVGLWALAGLVVLSTGAGFPLLRNLGLEPPSFATQYGLQAGAALEIPLVLIGLYFRSRDRRENRLRMQALSRTDPLTGVGSHRVLTERLEQLLDRQRRDPLVGALLRMRVSNLAALGNEFGREAAEAAMVRAAECVAREAREGDTVARERNGDLVLLLEGRLSREQVLAAGRNIIAGGLKFSGRLPPGATLSLHVAGACAPFTDRNAQSLLASLEQMLQEIAGDPTGRAMRIVQAPRTSSNAVLAAAVPPAVQ